MLVLLLKLSGTQRILINFIMILKSHKYAKVTLTVIIYYLSLKGVQLKRTWADFSYVVPVIKV